MFHRNSKRTQANSPKPVNDLTAIQMPEQLLADNKRQQLLNSIKEASSFTDGQFKSQALALIHNLINHCQSLPETENSYYSLPAGLLDYALNRTEVALQLFRHFVLQEGATLSEEQKLWLYALLSSALLKGIGKLKVDYEVASFDSHRRPVTSWNPLLESLSSQGHYYHYQLTNGGDNDLRCRLNVLLARFLMPQAGFAWIASNPAVLATWLALLNEDWQSAGTLGAILIRADAIAIQRFINEFMIVSHLGGGGKARRMSTFIDKASDSAFSKDKLIGAEFIQWLTQALEKGHIMINKAPLFSVPGGLLMSTEIFKWFVQEHPDYKNWQAVQNGFLALGLHETAKNGDVISRFEQAHTQHMVSGIVVSNYAVALPERLSYRHLNTGKVSEMTAIELIHKAQSGSNFVPHTTSSPSSSLSRLSADGQWSVPEKTNASLKAGQFRG